MNNYIFLKLGEVEDVKGNKMSGYQTIEAFKRNCNDNGVGYTWLGTSISGNAMAKKKVEKYNSIIRTGEKLQILFAVGEGVNDIVYTATILEIVSDRYGAKYPGEPYSRPAEFLDDKTAKIWLKLTDIREEKNLKAAMFEISSNNNNVKESISNGQCSFMYVNLPKYRWA